MWHIFEDEVKEQADPAVYEEEVGFFELSFDTETVKEAMKRARGEASSSPSRAASTMLNEVAGPRGAGHRRRQSPPASARRVRARSGARAPRWR